MSGRDAKFCQDRNGVRWVLIEGVINRKTAADDPAGGMNLPVAKIQSLEKTSVERRQKSPLAAPATLAGIVLLALSGWIASAVLWLGLPGLVLGAVVLVWGLQRLSGSVERLDASQIVAPGLVPADWLIVGSHAEVTGFVEGLKKEVAEAQRQQAAARN